MENYFQKTTAKPKAKANGKKQQKEKVVGMVQTAKVNRTVTTNIVKFLSTSGRK